MSDVLNPKTVGDHEARIKTLDDFQALAKQGNIDDAGFESWYTSDKAASKTAIATALQKASATGPVIGLGGDGTTLYVVGGPDGYAVVVPTPVAQINIDGTIGTQPVPPPAPIVVPTPVPTPVPGGTSSVSNPGDTGPAPVPDTGHTPAVDAAGNPLPEPTPEAPVTA